MAIQRQIVRGPRRTTRGRGPEVRGRDGHGTRTRWTTPRPARAQGRGDDATGDDATVPHRHGEVAGGAAVREPARRHASTRRRWRSAGAPGWVGDETLATHRAKLRQPAGGGAPGSLGTTARGHAGPGADRHRRGPGVRSHRALDGTVIVSDDAGSPGRLPRACGCTPSASCTSWCRPQRSSGGRSRSREN